MQPLNEYLNDHLFIQCIEHTAHDYRFDDVTASDTTVSKRPAYAHRTLRITFIGTGDTIEMVMRPHEPVAKWVKRFAEALDVSRPRNPQVVKHVVNGVIHHYTITDNLARTRHEKPVTRDDLRAHPLYNPDRHLIRTIPVQCQNLPGVVHVSHTQNQSPDDITAIVDAITSAQIDAMVERLYQTKNPPI